MISPLIDPNTRKKIEIHGANYRKVLDDYIGLDQVPRVFGGNDPTPLGSSAEEISLGKFAEELNNQQVQEAGGGEMLPPSPSPPEHDRSPAKARVRARSRARSSDLVSSFITSSGRNDARASNKASSNGGGGGGGRAKNTGRGRAGGGRGSERGGDDSVSQVRRGSVEPARVRTEGRHRALLRTAVVGELRDDTAEPVQEHTVSAGVTGDEADAHSEGPGGSAEQGTEWRSTERAAETTVPSISGGYSLALTGSYGLGTAFSGSYSWDGFDAGGGWLEPSGATQGPGWLMQNVEDESRRVDATEAHLRDALAAVAAADRDLDELQGRKRGLASQVLCIINNWRVEEVGDPEGVDGQGPAEACTPGSHSLALTMQLRRLQKEAAELELGARDSRVVLDEAKAVEARIRDSLARARDAKAVASRELLLWVERGASSIG